MQPSTTNGTILPGIKVQHPRSTEPLVPTVRRLRAIAARSFSIDSSRLIAISHLNNKAALYGAGLSYVRRSMGLRAKGRYNYPL
jgi:hypothetical protein